MGMAAIWVMCPGPFICTFVPPSQGGSTYNLALIGQAVSVEKMFENGGHIQVYSPGAGADNPLGSIFFSLTVLFSQYSLCCKFFPIK